MPQKISHPRRKALFELERQFSTEIGNSTGAGSEAIGLGASWQELVGKLEKSNLKFRKVKPLRVIPR